MNRIVVPLMTFLFIASGVWFLHDIPEPREYEAEEENEMEAGEARAKYEWLISRDPKTGRIPDGIRQRELAWARTNATRQSGVQGLLVGNNYAAVGPTRNGGRTRALAFDTRNNGTTNRVVLSGGINGGIFRSTDGGVTWTFVHPPEEIRSVSCIAQDTRPGFQDIWYAGTGEAIGASASYPNAFLMGFGIFKSTDNGRTWAKLANTALGNENTFDNGFDIVNNITVNPANGHVYAACFNSIRRSVDGGSNWQIVLRGTNPEFSFAGVTDILVTNTGSQLFAAFSGRNSDRALVGVWTSPSGDINAWTRIAGGLQNQPDSVPGWRAYDNTGASAGSFTAGWGRVVLGISANQSQLYVLVQNQQDGNTQPSADLFRGDISASPVTWSPNLGPNLVAKFNDADDVFYDTQGGYNMEIVGHPTQNNIIYLGGVELFRSTDGFATRNNNLYMGGLKNTNRLFTPDVSSTYSDPDFVSHVDYHRLRFDPASPNRMIAATDGGLSLTQDATAAKPAWELANINYQTLQYFHVNIDQVIGNRNYVGGAQDNSTTLRDKTGVLGPLPADSNDHYTTAFGDGGQTYFLNINGSNYWFLSAQENNTIRLNITTPKLDEIAPDGIGSEPFITYYHIDEDNPLFMYHPANDTLFRTKNSTTVTSASGWERLSGVNQAAAGEIYALATTRGPYSDKSMLLIGTADGKILRLRDPANTASNTVPDNITPSTMLAGYLVKDISINPRNQDTVIAVVSNYNVNSIYWTGNATAAIPIWQVIEGNLTLPSVRSCEVVAKTNGVEYYVGTTVGLFSTTTISANSTFWTRETGGPNGMMNTAIIQSLSYRWKDNTLLVGTHGNGMFVTTIGNATGPTGTNDPIRDDKNFIVKAFPTLTNNVVNYQAGNMLNIRSIQVQVYNLAGQVLYNQKSAYGSGTINVAMLPKGVYVLAITSNDRKYQFIRRFTKS